MRRRLVLWTLALGALAPGCIMAGNAGTLGASSLTNPVDDGTVDLSLDRRAFIIGTAFDFRVARVVTSLEMVTHEPLVGLTPDQRLDPTIQDKSYVERRLLRLDVPALTLWEFREGRIGYPGLIPHRHSLDLWARAGTADLDGDAGGFFGGALTYYRTGAFAVALTLDRWNEPADIRALRADGVNRTFAGDTFGWVVGFEVTLAAGEYALDIINELLGIDERIRQGGRRFGGAPSPGGAGWLADPQVRY